MDKFIEAEAEEIDLDIIITPIATDIAHDFGEVSTCRRI
jgi:hypothetical protein